MPMVEEGDSRDFDFLIKLLLIGDSGVGKSCLLIRFADDSFNTSFITTIGIDFKVRTVSLDGRRVKLQIWDTAGKERFKTITTANYRGAMGILLVYDVTQERTFGSIDNWLKAIEQHASASVNKLLIGNKADTAGPLVEKRAVERQRGQALADKHKMSFFETSAKESSNVDQAFLSIARDIKARLDAADVSAGGVGVGGMRLPGSGGGGGGGGSRSRLKVGGCC